MDLFEYPEQLPSEVQKVSDRYFDELHNPERNRYDICAELVTELNKLGYTCDYGLDAEPFDLKKLNQ